MVPRSTLVVVVVDDEVNILVALKRLFERAEIEVHTFESPVHALPELDRVQPDVVISDNYMPVSDGYSFLTGLRETHPHIRTVLMTGGAVTPQIDEALNESRIDRLILKPWSNVSLLQMVQQLALRPT